MQKAYVTYSTISSSSKKAQGEASRARWADLVQQVAIEHGKLIGNMAQGKFYDNIEKDPRDNIYADEKVDLKSLRQYKPLISSQKTTIADDKVNVRPAKISVDKYVDRMIELAKAAK